MKYEIIYDYEDSINLQETFEGTWHELQEEIKSMKKEGCYNIDATAVSEEE
jgi:hypothetical protein